MAGNKFIMKKDSLIDLKTGSAIVKYSGEQNKHFAAVIMCGHCGRLYYVPVVYVFFCKDIDEANSLAKNMPRAKRDYNNCVLCIGEIDERTARLIELFNKFDGYLKHADEGFDDSDVEKRKIVLPYMIDLLVKQDGKILKKDENIKDRHIKTADMYPEDMVLQKVFAPRIKRIRLNDKGSKYGPEGVEYIYPKKVKLNDFLDDYITAETYKKGVLNDNLSMLAMYYTLYGPNNKLNIKYKNKNIEYRDGNGKKVVRVVREPMRKYLEGEDVGFKSKEVKHQSSQDIVNLVGKNERAKSGLDRFKEKIKKMEAFKENEPQPGEE